MTKGELLIAQFRRYANVSDVITKFHSQEILSGYTNSELNCIDCIGRMRRPNAVRISEEMGMTRSAISTLYGSLLATRPSRFEILIRCVSATTAGFP